MNMNELTISQLKKAVALKEKIEALNKELALILGPSTTDQAPKKGKMSAAGRARIREAQKKRWAKIKAAQTANVKPASKPAPKTAKKKWKLSAAGLAKIKAANKAYWAKKKAAKK